MPATFTAEPRVTRTVIVVVVLALLAGAVVFLGKNVLDVATCYSPPSERQRSEQEAFLTSHLPDAGNYRWTVADCDDEGLVSLDFTTRSSGPAAAKLLLDDPACRVPPLSDSSELGVGCRSGGLDVIIFLEDDGAMDTRGSLTWTPA